MIRIRNKLRKPIAGRTSPDQLLSLAGLETSDKVRNGEVGLLHLARVI